MNIRGLISFRTDRFDPLANQGAPRSLLQHHSSKASILRHSALFTILHSYSYMTTGKTIALTIWTFVGKVMSLLLNTCLECHNFSFREQASFNFMATVTIYSDSEAQVKKVCYCFPSICNEVGTGCHDLHILNAEF